MLLASTSLSPVHLASEVEHVTYEEVRKDHG